MVLVSNETGEIADVDSVMYNHDKFCIIAKSEEDIVQITEMYKWCIPLGYDPTKDAPHLFSVFKFNKEFYSEEIGFIFYTHKITGEWHCSYIRPKDLSDDIPTYDIYIPEDIYEEVSDEELFKFINA